jgi:GntR family transcriptional regulator, transcriptional repressor for pyruvate dehydrogenase complex
MSESRTPPRDLPATSHRLPVIRDTAADQIIEQLRTQILTGALPLGAKLPTERELGLDFGVSSPTVREALRALNSMGLIEARQGSGAYVAANSDRIVASAMGMLSQLESVGLDDLLSLLAALNLYAAQLALGRATDEDIARVREQALATAQCATIEDVTAAAPGFLVTFAKAAHQPVLDALYGFLVTLVVQLEITSYKRKPAKFWQQWAKDTSGYRIAIAEALEKRDRTELTAAVTRFNDAVPARILSIPGLRNARMSDPSVAPLIAKIVSGR